MATTEIVAKPLTGEHFNMAPVPPVAGFISFKKVNVIKFRPSLSLRRMAMFLERAERMANEIIKRLAPYCSRIEVAGSIRRKAPNPRDIDLVLIPNDLWNFHAELMKLGQLKMSGKKLLRVMVGNTQVDIYVADEDTWAMLLLIRTGSKENNIRLCSLAQKRGWRLKANGEGLFDEKGRRIAGDTEQSIYSALGVKWQEPEERR